MNHNLVLYDPRCRYACRGRSLDQRQVCRDGGRMRREGGWGPGIGRCGLQRCRVSRQGVDEGHPRVSDRGGASRNLRPHRHRQEQCGGKPGRRETHHWTLVQYSLVSIDVDVVVGVWKNRRRRSRSELCSSNQKRILMKAGLKCS